jgi:hypothetical protein
MKKQLAKIAFAFLLLASAISIGIIFYDFKTLRFWLYLSDSELKPGESTFVTALAMLPWLFPSIMLYFSWLTISTKDPSLDEIASATKNIDPKNFKKYPTGIAFRALIFIFVALISAPVVWVVATKILKKFTAGAG